ncbi:MAG: hypothetical protein R3F59_01930 [Myxococcota bacterium]
MRASPAASVAFARLVAELAADAPPTGGDPPRDELERAIDRGDLESVHRQLRMGGSLPARTLRRVFALERPLLVRMIRMLRSKRLIPQDPSILDEAPNDEVRAWLAETLRL